MLLPLALRAGLLVLLHAGSPLAGAWRLLRRLGAAPDAAALGAMGFAGSSWFLSLTSTFNFYCSMAWFPWCWLAGESAFACAAQAPRWGGAALLAGGAHGAAAARRRAGGGAGERPRPRRARLPAARERLRAHRCRGCAALALLAAALGAVQLVPTAHRLAGTARGSGLVGHGSRHAGRRRPARLVDFVLPRFWGDSGRDEAGLWFGWGLHDRDFPYVVALYSGLLLTALAAAALLRWPIPYRGAWAFAAARRAAARARPPRPALGAAAPRRAAARRGALPGEVRRAHRRGGARSPGALGWQHLLAARRARRARAGVPARGARRHRRRRRRHSSRAVLAASPEVGADFIACPQRAAAVAAPRWPWGSPSCAARRWSALLLAGSGDAAAGAAAAPAAAADAVIAAAALVLLAGDLWWYGRGLEPTLAADEVLAPPPAVAAVRGAGGRLFSGPAFDHQPEIGVRRGPPGFQQLWARLQRLDPYAATLVGCRVRARPRLRPHAHVVGPSCAVAARGGLAATCRGRPPARRLGRRRAGAAPRPARADARAAAHRHDAGSPSSCCRCRRGCRATASCARSVHAADEAAATRELARRSTSRSADLCIGDAGPPPGALRRRRAARAARRGNACGCATALPDAAFLVAAITFDDGWLATLDDGTAAATCPTALGQLGVALPPGERTLTLRYRDPWVRVGAAASAIALLGAALFVLRRREPAAAPLLQP